MTRRTLGVLLAVLLLAQSRADSQEASRPHPPDQFLYQGTTEGVWLGEILVYLGMVGVCGTQPLYRLSPEEAVRMGPLVNRIEIPATAEEQREHYWFQLPRLSDETKPFVLLRLRLGDLEKVGELQTEYGSSREICESGKVDVVDVEFLPPEWWSAWTGLTQVLEDLVAESLTSVSAEKRRRLEELVERGAGQVRVMAKRSVREEWRRAATDIDPRAQIVTAYEEHKAGEWGRAFGGIVGRLGIQPRDPLPGEFRTSPALASAVSPAAPERGVFFERLGVAVRPIDATTAAEKMILDGVAVEKLYPVGEKLGLQENDIILTYRDLRTTIFGVSYRSYEPGEERLKAVEQGLPQFFEHAARWEGYPLLVLRGGEVIRLSLMDKADLIRKKEER